MDDEQALVDEEQKWDDAIAARMRQSRQAFVSGAGAFQSFLQDDYEAWKKANGISDDRSGLG